MNEKVLGYLLLAIGIILIVGSGVSVVMVFTKMAQPIALFSGPGISVDPNELMGQAGGGRLPKQELISGELLNQTSNLFAHVFLAGFVASIGQKLASLGVSLVRPIVLKVKEKEPGTYRIDHDSKV